MVEKACGTSLHILGMKRRKVVVIDDAHYGRVEDAHMGICHMICYAFMEKPDLGKM